jgi:hypothetical protein
MLRISFRTAGKYAVVRILERGPEFDTLNYRCGLQVAGMGFHLVAGKATVQQPDKLLIGETGTEHDYEHVSPIAARDYVNWLRTALCSLENMPYAGPVRPEREVVHGKWYTASGRGVSLEVQCIGKLLVLSAERNAGRFKPGDGLQKAKHTQLTDCTLYVAKKPGRGIWFVEECPNALERLKWLLNLIDPVVPKHMYTVAERTQYVLNEPWSCIEIERNGK